MKNLTAFYQFLKASTNPIILVIGLLGAIAACLAAPLDANAQTGNISDVTNHTISDTNKFKLHKTGYTNFYHEIQLLDLDMTQVSIVQSDSVPDPRFVMRQSILLPGRGQITNAQAWKVPVIYGLFAGVISYTIYSDTRYRGYRAAYYNSFAQNTDLRFGPTPTYIPQGLPAEQYRFNRNSFRNRRDLSFVGLLLVYGLNIADAYIFAHLRDFDVSDDLSSIIEFMPDYIQHTPYVAVRLNIRF
jgi:hypothetical protein